MYAPLLKKNNKKTESNLILIFVSRSVMASNQHLAPLSSIKGKKRRGLGKRLWSNMSQFRDPFAGDRLRTPLASTRGHKKLPDTVTGNGNLRKPSGVGRGRLFQIPHGPLVHLAFHTARVPMKPANSCCPGSTTTFFGRSMVSIDDSPLLMRACRLSCPKSCFNYLRNEIL